MKTTITPNGVTFSFEIPRASKGEFDIKRAEQMTYALEVFKAYGPFLVKCVRRRLNACNNELTSHLEDAKYIPVDSSDSEEVEVLWKRSNGRIKHYSTASALKMKKTIANLKVENFDEVINDYCCIRQILKAIMNDTEPHPSEALGIYWDELVSILLYYLET